MRFIDKDYSNFSNSQHINFLNNEYINNYQNYDNNTIFYLIKNIQILGSFYNKVNNHIYNWHHRGDRCHFALCDKNIVNNKSLNQSKIYLVFKRFVNENQEEGSRNDITEHCQKNDLSLVTINDETHLILCLVKIGGYVKICEQQFIIGLTLTNKNEVKCIQSNDLYIFDGFYYILQK